jgi:hyperosmotically inducible protein
MIPRLSLATALLAGVFLVGCEREGAAERAGKQIDESLERAEKKIEQAAQNAGERLEQAGEELRDKADR